MRFFFDSHTMSSGGSMLHWAANPTRHPARSVAVGGGDDDHRVVEVVGDALEGVGGVGHRGSYGRPALHAMAATAVAWPAMARDLAGRVAIVGLDQADVARRLAAEGATVVLVGDDADAAGALLAEIEAAATAGAGPGGLLQAGRPTPALGLGRPGSASAPDGSGAGGVQAGGSGRAGTPSSGPTESELDALVELVAEMWPAR